VQPPEHKQPATPQSNARTAMLTATAVVAFAANSLLCRTALTGGLIDAASFTSIRIASGALILALLLFLRRRPSTLEPTNVWAALMLFAYMAFFSFAYLSLGAGTGALILFGAVQLTMFVAALRGGEHFPIKAWAGLLLAVVGLVYLLSPGLSAPDPKGAALMALAGVAWGFYSLIGKRIANPLAATTKNFLTCVPLAAVASLFFLEGFNISPLGIGLAVASGALTSGLGYVIWYAALPGLTASRAATVQLSVPAIAAFGGAFLLSEDITARLLIASAATLGGVAIVLMQKTKKAQKSA